MQNKITTKNNVLFSHWLSKVSVAGPVLFLILLTALHFIEPEFNPSYDPSKHLISGYELGNYGWMMSIAFVSLGIGVLSLVISTWSYPKTRSNMVGRWWLLIIFAAFIGASIFYPLKTLGVSSIIHAICGIFVILTYPVAATLYGLGLSFSKDFENSKRWKLLVTILVWIGFLTFFIPIFTANNLVICWGNRVMMLLYSLWLILVGEKVAFFSVASTSQNENA